VPDPDFVVSPAEALEEARRRIAQMRASLQTNINRVSQSFEHPVFMPVDVSVQEAPPFVSVPQAEVPAASVNEAANSFESLFETEEKSVIAPPVVPTSQPTFTQSTSSQQESQRVESVITEVREEPRVFTQSTQQTSPTIIIDEAANQTHSLELVIMRDEVKDLRDRLDSSQKLIENLMVRLADLAELALKRKD
jgi:HAMP domain-containing protein